MAKKSTKPKQKRKPQPKATMTVSVKGKLKGTQVDRWGGSQATFDWEVTDKGKIKVTAPCGTSYTFDKKTIKDFADLIDKAGKAKVTFD